MTAGLDETGRGWYRKDSTRRSRLTLFSPQSVCLYVCVCVDESDGPCLSPLDHCWGKNRLTIFNRIIIIVHASRCKGFLSWLFLPFRRARCVEIIWAVSLTTIT